MGEYSATVRLTDEGADIRLGQARFWMTGANSAGTGHGCPVSHLAGALGG
jgi:hypothetical protein